MLLENSFEIKLPQFEGPFDLLLFFIERDELDIYNIPIAKITDDFLNYIHQMNTLNIELASEFIFIAATLMRIKVKMLLPRHEVDDEGNEIDPRKDLVEQLLAYKRYKAAVEDLKLMEEDRMKREKRGNVLVELEQVAKNSPYADELNSLTLFKLLHAFEKVLERHQNAPNQVSHTVFQYSYSMEGQKSHLLNLLSSSERVSFVDVFKEARDKFYIIFTFLAMLELIAEQIVSITLGQGFNNFWLSRK